MLCKPGVLSDTSPPSLRPTRAPASQVVCKPGSIKPHRKFKGEIYALSKEEGGRHTPFFTNYKPQFFFRTADVTGACRRGGRRGAGRVHRRCGVPRGTAACAAALCTAMPADTLFHHPPHSITQAPSRCLRAPRW